MECVGFTDLLGYVWMNTQMRFEKSYVCHGIKSEWDEEEEVEAKEEDFSICLTRLSRKPKSIGKLIKILRSFQEDDAGSSA